MHPAQNKGLPRMSSNRGPGGIWQSGGGEAKESPVVDVTSEAYRKQKWLREEAVRVKQRAEQARRQAQEALEAVKPWCDTRATRCHHLAIHCAHGFTAH